MWRVTTTPKLTSTYTLAAWLLLAVQTTPVWRAGPAGPKTLCNACGVRFMKIAKRKA
jgi:hypothetical protein